MKKLSKTMVGTFAAGALAMSTATPAFADDFRGRDHGGISAGEIIAGAVIIGGIAAVASAASHNNDRFPGYDRDYRYDRAGFDNGGNYGRIYDRDSYWRGNPRQAVEMCVRAAEDQANRYSFGRADVTDIRSVNGTRYGFEVKGRIAVNGTGRGWRNGDSTYGRGWSGDYRGWNDNLRGYDSGAFRCRIERGRVVGLNFNGVRGL